MLFSASSPEMSAASSARCMGSAIAFSISPRPVSRSLSTIRTGERFTLVELFLRSLDFLQLNRAKFFARLRFICGNVFASISPRSALEVKVDCTHG